MKFLFLFPWIIYCNDYLILSSHTLQQYLQKSSGTDFISRVLFRRRFNHNVKYVMFLADLSERLSIRQKPSCRHEEKYQWLGHE